LSIAYFFKRGTVLLIAQGMITASSASVKKGVRAPRPESVKPMLCTLLKEPFNDPKYLYEIKWDGYRSIGYSGNGKAKLDSRGGLDFSKKYPGVITALTELGSDAVLDGEIVLINKEGKPDFDALQKVNGGRAPVFYYVFDILWLNGVNLMQLPLVERKKILKEAVTGKDVIRYSDDFDNGIELFEHAKSLGLEGIVAKMRNSSYHPDERGNKWYKIPTSIKQEFVIGGWIESESGRPFRTLLFGVYEGDKLMWVGHAGGGYKEAEMPAILKKLKALEIGNSPFFNEVDYDGKVHWVKPELVANIKYATFTRSGKIRKPAIFLGFRDDKKPKNVVKEVAHDTKPAKKTAEKTDTLAVATSDSNWPEVENQKVTSKEIVSIDGCSLELTNVERQIWKGVSKGHLIKYYLDVADFILPHLHNRPLSLYLKLKGPHAPGLYIKDMEGRQPQCSEIYSTARKHKKRGKRDVIDYLVCNNIATLLYLINLGCIDVNPWASSISNPEQPDFIVIDLDPSDKDFSKVIVTAQHAKELFDERRLKTFVKTSGKTGIHIFVPCSGWDFSQARNIAENICKEVHVMVPEITTTEMDITSRGVKLYLDPNQNDYSDTVASVYSVRPNKIPTVSTPLEWKEVNEKLDPEAFTIDTIKKRLEKKGDLFSSVLDKTIAAKNNKVLKQFLGS
jgi:bifunctional non-homologous end joining protein LigD